MTPLLLVGRLALAFVPPGAGHCTARVQLTDAERAGFETAAHGPRPEVFAELLTAVGCEDVVLASLPRLHARVRFSDARVGYVLVSVPKASVLGLLDIPGLAGAFATSADSRHSFPYPDPWYVPASQRMPAPVPAIAIPIPRVATTLADSGPYFAAAEAGLSALWRHHPSADGRGVTVAVIDGGIDLLHPALERVQDSTGRLVPKVVDVLAFSDPAQDANWVQFGDPIRTVNGTFRAVGHTWTVPYDGTFRFGMFTERLHLGPWRWTREEAPHVSTVSLSVGVLWDEERHRVWVDTDGDGNFRNQRALDDYGETQDVDWFGVNVDGDDNRIPFGVKIDRRARAVYLTLTDDPHGVLVAGPLSANRLTGGLFDGAAPNARLIDVRHHPLEMLIPAILTSFARPDVAVVNQSGLVSCGDFEEFYRRVIERAVEVYGKPLVSACQAAHTLQVADYQSPQMLQRNRQLPPPYDEAVNGGTWWPTRDGLVNLVLGPSTSLMTDSRYMPDFALWPDRRLHLTSDILEPPAPAGYGIGSNASPTMPVVAGVLADLIGEATREDIRYNATRLATAVLTSARPVARFATAQQGFGVVDAAGAWDQLVRMAQADDPANPILTSFDLQRTRVGAAEPVQGIVEDRLRAGDTLRDELWITRRGGYAGGRAYALTLRGDDSTYALTDSSLTLVRDVPTRVGLVIRVRPGVHAAFLRLSDARVGAVMQEVPLYVRAPDVPTRRGVGMDLYEETLPPLYGDRRLIPLDSGVQASRFVMRIPYAGPSSVSYPQIPGLPFAFASGRRVASAGSSDSSLDAAHHVGPMETFESLVPNSEPGLQTIYWENRGRPEYGTPYDDTAPDIPITGTLTVAKYAVTFTTSAGSGVHATNALADIDGTAEFYDATLASERLVGQGRHADVSMRRTLGAGVRQWRVQIGPTSPTPAVADAFLLDCTGKNGCSVVRQAALHGHSVLLVADDPAAGTWQIVVRTREATAERCSYRVRDAILTPAAGVLPAERAVHASGSTWSVSRPVGASDAQYVAFHIAAPRSRDTSVHDVRIAMTPLTHGIP